MQKANQINKQQSKPRANPFSNKNNSRQLAWSEEPSIHARDLKTGKEENEEVSYYSENEESEYYDTEEDADKVPS